MKPRTRPRNSASIGSNQASPVNSDSDPLVVVISLFMAWSPAGASTPGLGCWSQPETTPPQFPPHPRRHLGISRGATKGIHNMDPLLVLIEPRDHLARVRLVQDLVHVDSDEPWLAVQQDRSGLAAFEVELGQGRGLAGRPGRPRSAIVLNLFGFLRRGGIGSAVWQPPPSLLRAPACLLGTVHGRMSCLAAGSRGKDPTARCKPPRCVCGIRETAETPSLRTTGALVHDPITRPASVPGAPRWCPGGVPPGIAV